MLLSHDCVLLFYTRADDIAQGALEARCLKVLSPEELEKAQRFRDIKGRHLSLMARALVRYLISEYSGQPPAALTFTTNDHGKPALSPDPAFPVQRDLRFNLSHCRGGVVCAISLGSEVGVDLESLDRRVNPAVAHRFFSPQEAARVQRAVAAGNEKGVFLDIWTLKEAYIKAVGKGLAIPLNSFSFDSEGPAVKVAFRAGKGDPGRWQFFRWRPEPGKLAAAAVCSSHPLAFKTFRCIPFKKSW